MRIHLINYLVYKYQIIASYYPILIHFLKVHPIGKEVLEWRTSSIHFYKL